LGKYLKTYLRLDVDILYCAIQGLRQRIAKEIGVDFVQTGNFTISSVSIIAKDWCAETNLQFGPFFQTILAFTDYCSKEFREREKN
jgi:hypothetical protein